MRQKEKTVSKLRRPFVAAGAVAGAVGCGFYLYHSAGRASVGADPVWTRFVNVALIMFVSIYLANLLRRVVERCTRKD